MLGIEGTVDLVVEALEARTPAKLVELRARYSQTADGDGLPDVGLFAASQRARIERAEYPALEVIGMGMNRPKVLDKGLGTITYQFPYVIRIFVTVRGNGFDDTDLRRKRTTLAVVEELVASPALSFVPSAWIDIASLRISNSDVAPGDKTDSRSVASAFVEVAVIVEEMTEALPTLATANTIAIHPSLLPQVT